MDAIRQEQSAFDAQLADLIAQGHEGKFVLFKDGRVQDLFESSDAAYGEGLRRYGSQAVFLITQVARPAPSMGSLTWELGLMLVS